MQARKKYDVIIAGSGLTGLSTAFHLQQSGVTNVALCLPDSNRPSVHRSPGLITGGQIDNFTRFSHNYGKEIAAQLWAFGDRAYTHLLRYCSLNGIGTQAGTRLRLITSAAELREAEIAVSQLTEAGLSANLETLDVSTFGPLFSQRVLAVQSDGAGGAWIDERALISTLTRALTADKLGRMLRYDFKDGRFFIHTSESVFECEMLVIACHLATADYLPELRDALISVADQWSVFSYDPADHPAVMRPFVYSANHTYEWGAVTGNGQIVLGGGRYLRKHAGIEAKEAFFEEKIEQHLTHQFQNTMTEVKIINRVASAAALDCRPCDELPIIGPMFGNSRILVATGYMGNGLALGFYAGHCLTELINKGTSDSCPRKMHPERLRSLEN